MYAPVASCGFHFGRFVVGMRTIQNWILGHSVRFLYRLSINEKPGSILFTVAPGFSFELKGFLNCIKSV